ncbi:MAG: DUF1801 domain-containing protein [Limnochordia bacterium]|jgi:hypothetical protein
MRSRERHPHIDGASERQLAELLEDKDPDIRLIYLATHRLILETLPEVKYATDCTDGQTGYGARQFGYDGWGMGALGAFSRWVSLVFFRGTDLHDPSGLLEGSGKRLRHVKLRSLDEFEKHRAALQELIEMASRVGDG